jgi:hypothetical protein
MSDRQHHAEGDVLERATAALRDTRPLDGPPEQVVASTIEALQALDTRPDTVRLLERRKLMFRIARYSSAAAAVLVAAIAGSIWLMDRNASFSFAQVVDNIDKAKSVQFAIQQKLGHGPELQGKMFIQGDQVRYEVADWIIDILDLKQHKGLELEPQRKVARKMDLTGKMPAEMFKDPIDQLRHLRENIKHNVVQLSDEELNGRKCHLYQVTRPIKREAALLIPDQFRLWVDAKTGLPVRIVAQDTNTLLVYDHFRWDEPLPAELFSLQVPQGYRLEELTPAIIKPNRIYYQQGWIELHSIRPDGQDAEVQFVPQQAHGAETYVADKSELSPDARYLAIGYTHSTKKGSFPPDRVLLWDRTQPKAKPVEVYTHPEGELQSWQFSADGRRLYVNWWEQLPGKEPGTGRTGTDAVDLITRAKHAVKLPTFLDIDGQEKAMRFAAASADGQTFLVVGQGLYVATAEGNVVRRLTTSVAPVIVSSVRLSPDGKHAMYTTFHSQQGQELAVVSLAGDEPKVLVPAGGFTDLRARWSPDGKRIAYTSRLLGPTNPPFYYGTETYLQIVDADGSNVTMVLSKTVPPKGTSLQLVAWR